MKQTIIAITFALLLLSACVQVAEKPYKFGAVLPLSGSLSLYGEYAKYGIELAVEDINKAGGINGRTVVAVYEDTGSDKAKAATAAQKLVGVDEVDALFSLTSGHVGVIAPIAEQAGIPFVYNAYSNVFAQNKTFVFKDYPDVAELCKVLMVQAKKKHENIAFFGVDGETFRLCTKEIEDELSLIETHNFGETDFRTQFTKIKNSGETALFLLEYAQDCPTSFKLIRELGISSQIYLPFHLSDCGREDNTVPFADLFVDAYGVDAKFDESSEFVQRLESRGWTKHLLGSSIVYDSIMEMANASESCRDSVCIADNLRNLNNYQGVSGLISYGGDQIVEREVVLQKFENGKWVIVK